MLVAPGSAMIDAPGSAMIARPHLAVIAETGSGIIDAAISCCQLNVMSCIIDLNDNNDRTWVEMGE